MNTVMINVKARDLVEVMIEPSKVSPALHSNASSEAMRTAPHEFEAY